jgi:ATP-binding cassette subfamily B protein
MGASSLLGSVRAAWRAKTRAWPCVRQHDHNDCGPACLATVAKHFGLPLSVGRLRDLCRSDAMGTSLLGLAKAAEALGFSAKPARATWDALAKCPRPLIVHVLDELPGFAGQGKAGHFMVVFDLTERYVVVADPARGVRRLERKEFEGLWTGMLLLLVPTPSLAAVSPSLPPWRRFLGLLRGRWSLLVESLLASVLYAALGLGTSFYVQHVVDDILVRGNLSLLHVASLGCLLLIIFRVVFHVLEQYLLVHLSQKIDVSLTLEYYQHVLGLPLSFFEARQTGEILSRLSDAQKIRQAVSGTILSAIVDVVFVIAAGTIMLLDDARLAAVTLACAPAFVLVVLAHRSAIRKEQRKAMEQSAALQSHLVEVVAGAAAVKAAGAEENARAGAEQRLLKTVRTGYRIAMLSLSTSAMTLLLTALGSLAVMWYGGVLVVRGELTLGQLLFFQSLLGHILEPLGRLAMANVDLENAAVAADRVADVFAIAPEQPRLAERLRPKALEGRLALEDVHFRYGYRDWALRGVTIEVEPGKTIALVGRSGSGKSTIGKLAARFYDPTQGRVLVDGHDLRDLDLRWYRDWIGIVDQECVVFSASVADNIRLGKPEASLEDVIRAAREAGAHEFVEKLPERYETLLGERGSNLSGGQRQRIAIARAILGDPRILVLDEATSHLDSDTEQAVQATLARVMSARTTIVIAHRLSTVLLADLVYVLEDGKVVESGTHAELIEKGGPYTKMWLAQVPAGLFPEEDAAAAEADERQDVILTGLDEPPAGTETTT